MLLRSRHFIRRSVAFGLALLLAGPATAMFMRWTVHFAASFDVTSAPGGGLQADVGQISVMAPPTEFIVVPADGGGGELMIVDDGTTAQATLTGTFKTVFGGQQLDASWSMRASQIASPLDIRFVDDSDSGMIDAGFGGDGTIVVGGQHVMPYVPGTSYDCELSLSDPLVGPATWSVLVTADDGSGAVGMASGPLPSAMPLTVKAVKLIRPAGASAGQFIVDDLKAVSSIPSFK